jgi:uncharacterized protein YabE (DUF348 family)
VRKIIPAVVAGGAVLALAAGTFGYAALQKDLTLSIDGASTSVSTRSRTVGDVLAEKSITVGERDVVAPALDERVTDGTRIAIKFARQVTVTVDGKPQTFWTTATTVGQALMALGIENASAQVSTSRSSGIGREGIHFDFDTAKTIVITAAGKKRTVKTYASTVGEALADAKIVVDDNDRLSTRPGSALTDGSKVTYVKVDVKTVDKKETIRFAVVRKTSKTMNQGTTKVEKAGVTGTRSVTYRLVLENGKVVKKSKTASKVLKAPISQVLIVGTKKVETAASVPSGSVWDRLARCESGGNWSINTGNGFYGGLQFSASTWHAYGGSGLPHQHSREQQIAIAKKLQAAAGWGSWPGCSSKLGLR